MDGCGARGRGDTRPASQIPEDDRDYFLERRYPAFGNLVPPDVTSRAAIRGIGPIVVSGGRGAASASTWRPRSIGWERTGRGTLRQPVTMYERITDESPYEVPMRVYPGRLHHGRAVGGLRPHVDDPRVVRPRRGQLLRSRRQSARRQRAHAGSRRWVLRRPLHPRRLPGRLAEHGSGPDHRSRLRSGTTGG